MWIRQNVGAISPTYKCEKDTEWISNAWMLVELKNIHEERRHKIKLSVGLHISNVLTKWNPSTEVK